MTSMNSRYALLYSMKTCFSNRLRSLLHYLAGVLDPSFPVLLGNHLTRHSQVNYMFINGKLLFDHVCMLMHVLK